MNFYQLADALFRRGYLRELRKQLPAVLPDTAKTICVQIEQDADALFEANKVMAIDAPSTSNLKTTSLALATYRLLRARGIERTAALNFLRATLIESNRKKMKSFMLILRLSRNPLAMMGSISESKAKSAYGEAFEFEHETDNKQTYFTTKVKKCLFHDFFRANGAPEITPVFCAFDDLWGDLLETGEYGVRFTRPTTIGWGDDICRFEFKRTPRGVKQAD